MDMLSKRDFEDEVNEPALEQAANVTSVDEQKAERENPVTAKRRLIKQIAIPIGILLLGVAVVGLITLLEQPAEKKSDPVLALQVDTLPVNSGSVTFAIDSQGTVAPWTETVLVTEVSGVIESVSPKLQVGGFFEKGEILLTIDASDYQASVKQAEANLLGKKAKLTQEQAQSQQAEKEWAITGRPKQDAPVLALRQPFLEEAKAGVLFAEAELDQAKRKLARTQIRAPYDGLVKSKKFGIGQYVTVGTALAEVFAVDYAEVRLALSDDELAFLQLPTPRDLINRFESNTVNQSTISGVNVTLLATVGGTAYQWPAKIDRTEGVIDSRSRVHYAVAQVADPYGLHSQSLTEGSSGTTPALSIGSFVKAKIQGITVSDVFTVPRNAFRDENTLMIVDVENRLHLRNADVVRSDNDFVYITSGINPGDEVITTGIVAPVEGMQVRKSSAQISTD